MNVVVNRSRPSSGGAVVEHLHLVAEVKYAPDPIDVAPLRRNVAFPLAHPERRAWFFVASQSSPVAVHPHTAVLCRELVPQRERARHPAVSPGIHRRHCSGC
jgi:hypothetical protein